MAHLTLARKIAAITLTIWKKGVRFDAEPETTSSLSVWSRTLHYLTFLSDFSSFNLTPI